MAGHKERRSRNVGEDKAGAWSGHSGWTLSA